MKNNLKEMVDSRLAHVDWHGEEAVLKSIRGNVRVVKRRTLIIAIALLLMLCMTALALSLSYSARYDILKQAKSALGAKYGLTEEMLDMFTTVTTERQDGSQVDFMPLVYEEQIGRYTVIQNTNGATEATWSHDGKDTGYAQGDLNSPIWDARQLERYIYLRRENANVWNDEALSRFEEMTLEQRAALDAMLIDFPQTKPYINIAPNGADITEHEAVALAKMQLQKRYGISMEALDDYVVSKTFYLVAENNTREYWIDFAKDRIQKNGYSVHLMSPTGEITYIKWWVEDDERTLPQGDLAQYRDAAREYAMSSAFELLSTDEQAKVIKRFEQAGLRALLPMGDYLLPQNGDMIEQEARYLAKAAVEAAYALPDGWEQFFSTRMELMLFGGQRAWRISYIPKETDNWHWRYWERFGEYTVVLNAYNGETIHCLWSDAFVNEHSVYTETTFGTAKAYTAEMMPWIMTLLDNLDEVLSAYPKMANIEEMSLEDQARYDAIMLRAGYDEKRYCHILPQEGDITKEEAVKLARQLIVQEYGVSEALLSDAEGLVGMEKNFDLEDSPIRTWRVQLSGCGADHLDGYTVIVNAETGALEGIWHDSPSVGNG